jgi:hypothetical protein
MSPYEDDELDAGCAAENKELKKAKKRREWILLRLVGGRNEEKKSGALSDSYILMSWRKEADDMYARHSA